jgi:hypothetical protein
MITGIGNIRPSNREANCGQATPVVEKNVAAVSGATIMGDGGVARIMDVAAVMRHADQEAT